ncbi:MAG: hypothetical protein AAB262_02000, partial [Elusimicrobiota bacterium]
MDALRRWFNRSGRKDNGASAPDAPRSLASFLSLRGKGESHGFLLTLRDVVLALHEGWRTLIQHEGAVATTDADDDAAALHVAAISQGLNRYFEAVPGDAKFQSSKRYKALLEISTWLPLVIRLVEERNSDDEVDECEGRRPATSYGVVAVGVTGPQPSGGAAAASWTVCLLPDVAFRIPEKQKVLTGHRVLIVPRRWLRDPQSGRTMDDDAVWRRVADSPVTNGLPFAVLDPLGVFSLQPPTTKTAGTPPPSAPSPKALGSERLEAADSPAAAATSSDTSSLPRDTEASEQGDDAATSEAPEPAATENDEDELVDSSSPWHRGSPSATADGNPLATLAPLRLWPSLPYGLQLLGHAVRHETVMPLTLPFPRSAMERVVREVTAEADSWVLDPSVAKDARGSRRRCAADDDRCFLPTTQHTSYVPVGSHLQAALGLTFRRPVETRPVQADLVHLRNAKDEATHDGASSSSSMLWLRGAVESVLRGWVAEQDGQVAIVKLFRQLLLQLRVAALASAVPAALKDEDATEKRHAELPSDVKAQVLRATMPSDLRAVLESIPILLVEPPGPFATKIESTEGQTPPSRTNEQPSSSWKSTTWNVRSDLAARTPNASGRVSHERVVTLMPSLAMTATRTSRPVPEGSETTPRTCWSA